MSAIISRLFQAFGFTPRPQESPRESIDRIIVKLEVLQDKAAEIRYRFETRSRELWEKTVELLRKGEKTRATIYAGEIAQVRNIIKLIHGMENMIIMTKERLKTVRDVGEIGQVLMVFGTALEEIKDHARAIYPNLNLFFDEVSRNVKSLIVETTMNSDAVERIDPVVISKEAEEMLQQAMKKAEEEVKEEFPEPPIDTIVKLEARKQPVAVAIGGPSTQPTKPKTTPRRRRSIEELEQLVLNYIRNHNGILDIKEFTTIYGVTKNEVLQAIHRLAEKGLIALS